MPMCSPAVKSRLCLSSIHPWLLLAGAEVMGQKNLVASAEALVRMGVEVVQSDRGGDVTFHGPGQLVGYPIIRLSEHKLSVGSYVRLLQDVVIDALRTLGVESHRDESAVGVWVGDQDRAEKILRWACESAAGFRCMAWR